MNKYKILKEKNMYKVVEISTDETIKLCDTYNKANKMKTFLQNGGGFDGFTPNFMVKKINIINSAT